MSWEKVPRYCREAVDHETDRRKRGRLKNEVQHPWSKETGSEQWATTINLVPSSSAKDRSTITRMAAGGDLSVPAAPATGS